MSHKAAMPRTAYIQPQLFDFFRDLSRHNERDWFLAHKEQYETFVKKPLQAFASDWALRLQKLSRHLDEGRMMRINRDIRFSADKSPYRTHAGLNVGHADSGEGPSAGFYLHLAPGEVFLGSGLWSPDTETQNRIRTAIVKKTDAWKRATHSKGFPGLSSMHEGDTLKRPPRGFDPEHPFVEDLKRKHFIASHRFSEKDAVSAAFPDEVMAACKTTAPLVAFLTQALGLAW